MELYTNSTEKIQRPQISSRSVSNTCLTDYKHLKDCLANDDATIINTDVQLSKTLALKKQIDSTSHSQVQNQDERQNQDQDHEQNLDMAIQREQEESREEQLLMQNEDYQMVLRALNILRRQLKQATKDIEELKRLKEDAMKDPFGFVKKLKDGSNGSMPTLQKIISAPLIDWTRYQNAPKRQLSRQLESYKDSLSSPFKPSVLAYSNTISNPTQSHTSSFRTFTRPAPRNRSSSTLSTAVARAAQTLGPLSPLSESPDVSEDDSDNDIDQHMEASQFVGGKLSSRSNGRGYISAGSKRLKLADHVEPDASTHVKVKEESPQTEDSNHSSASPTENLDQTGRRSSRPVGKGVLGKSKDDPDKAKSATHNQPWTDGEQQRLEELLVVYPDEPVQAQRFKKIAAALGTRTERQVASRIQKYFIKLAKAGLPVPGKFTIPPSTLPKAERERVSKLKSIRRGSCAKPNKFFSKKKKKLSMIKSSRRKTGYNSAISGGLTTRPISGSAYAHTHIPPTLYMSDDDDATLNGNGKEDTRQEGADISLIAHHGFSCDGCEMEPIIGTRYKCIDCDISKEVDLCDSCMKKGEFQNAYHTLSHNFEAVQSAETPYYADNDYRENYMDEYSYLEF